MEEKEKTTFNSSAILDVNTMFVDPTALDFKLMHQVYVAKQNGQESGISNPEKEEEYLKLAHIWIDAYSQATGRPNSGEIAFTNCIDEYGFQVAMEVAQNMRGYKIEKVRDVLVATFGPDNPLASEVIVRFIMHPKIASMFEIYSYHTSVELEAKHEKDKILAGGEERKKAILQEYFAAISREPIVAQTSEEVEEAKPQKESTTSVTIPALTFADFSPKKMFEYKDLLEYENGKVVIIGPNGERVIDENPDDNKIAYLNEIWEATCWEVEQMMSQSQETPIINSASLFEKDNKIILQKISEMLQGEKPINNVDAILTKLAQVDGIEDVVSSIIKADKFLTYLKFYGEMDLDFKGCHQTEYYIEMARAHQQAPAMEMEREF